MSKIIFAAVALASLSLGGCAPDLNARGAVTKSLALPAPTRTAPERDTVQYGTHHWEAYCNSRGFPQCSNGE